MTPEQFIEWIKNEYGAKNRTRAVLKAEELLKKSHLTIWRWLSHTQQCPDDSMLHMEKTVKIHELKKEIERLKKKLEKLTTEKKEQNHK